MAASSNVTSLISPWMCSTCGGRPPRERDKVRTALAGYYALRYQLKRMHLGCWSPGVLFSTAPWLAACQ